MASLNFTAIWLLVVFIVPGYLAHVVSNTLYKPEDKYSEIEVIYSSVLYSASIYIFLYFIALSRKMWIENYVLSHPRATIIIFLVTSNIWGVIVYLFKRYDWFHKAISLLKIPGGVVPPNVFASIFDPKYQPKAKNGYWLIFKQNGVTYEAFAQYTDVRKEFKVYVVDVREIDSEGRSLKQYPDTFGMLVDIRKLEEFEIVYS
jgi:hypothetical protein